MNLGYWPSIDLTTTRFIVMCYCDLWSGREVVVTIIYKVEFISKIVGETFSIQLEKFKRWNCNSFTLKNNAHKDVWYEHVHRSAWNVNSRIRTIDVGHKRKLYFQISGNVVMQGLYYAKNI